MSHSSLQEIVALFGHPAAGDPAQYVMEQALARAGLDWRFLTLEVTPDDLHDALRGMRAMGFRGAALAGSHQAAAAPLVDDLSESAQRIGAINCIRREENRLVGENTIGAGCVKAMRAVLDPAGKNVVVLGAGETARAIVVELAAVQPARVTIVSQTQEQAAPLVDMLKQQLGVNAEFMLWQKSLTPPAGTDLLVRAESGENDNACAYDSVNLSSLREDAVVADAEFNPFESRFLSAARERGLRTMDGLDVLAQQIALCFQLWTGLEPDAAQMRDALDEFLSV